MYITVKQVAKEWGISDRRVRILCSVTHRLTLSLLTGLLTNKYRSLILH